MHMSNVHVCAQRVQTVGPEVIKLFSYSTQLSTKFILLINVKTFISMINTIFERLKARNFFFVGILGLMSS